MSVFHDAVKKASQAKQVTRSPEPDGAGSPPRQNSPVARLPRGIIAVILCTGLGMVSGAYFQYAQARAARAMDSRLSSLSSEIAQLRGGQSDLTGRLDGIQRGSELTQASLGELTQGIEQVALQVRSAVSDIRAGQARLGRLEKTLSDVSAQLYDLESRVTAPIATAASGAVAAAQANDTERQGA